MCFNCYKNHYSKLLNCLFKEFLDSALNNVLTLIALHFDPGHKSPCSFMLLTVCVEHLVDIKFGDMGANTHSLR